MKGLGWIIVCMLLSIHVVYAAEPKTVMLVLGSADPVVLKERIGIAARLYGIRSFHKIIVSGGCGAHGSGICEASDMKQGLMARGIDPSKIYKEENAKTTVQNYVFSRILRDEHDARIIQPKDTVYVVSNHWHAISVAARLQKYDDVVARFHIEGAVMPKENDKLDYVGIFNAQPDNEKFVLRGSWLTPEAVWSIKDTTFYLSNNLVYGTDDNNNAYTLKDGGAVFPFLNNLDDKHSRAFIDAGKYWWVRNGERLIRVEKKSGKIVEQQSWASWIKGMPGGWKSGYFATGVFYNDTLLLFSYDRVLVARVEKNGLRYVEDKAAGSYFTNWPFSWGKSNVSAAVVDPKNGDLTLYRNMEKLKVDKQGIILGKPEPFKLKWIEDLK